MRGRCRKWRVSGRNTSLSLVPPEAVRRWPRREYRPFINQFPLEERLGISKDELPSFGLTDRAPCWRKEYFHGGSVCTLLLGLVAGWADLPLCSGGVIFTVGPGVASSATALPEGKSAGLAALFCDLLSSPSSSEIHSTVLRWRIGLISSWLPGTSA